MLSKLMVVPKQILNCYPTNVRYRTCMPKTTLCFVDTNAPKLPITMDKNEQT